MSEPTDPREGTPLQRALSDIVRERLTASAMTQADAAAFVGVSEKHLSRILNGRDEGTLTMWQRLLDFVDGDLADVKATARAKGAAEERSKAFSLQHTKPIRAAVSDAGVDAHNRAVWDVGYNVGAADSAVIIGWGVEGADPDKCPELTPNPYRADATERGDS